MKLFSREQKRVRQWTTTIHNVVNTFGGVGMRKWILLGAPQYKWHIGLFRDRH